MVVNPTPVVQQVVNTLDGQGERTALRLTRQLNPLCPLKRPGRGLPETFPKAYLKFSGNIPERLPKFKLELSVNVRIRIL